LGALNSLSQVTLKAMMPGVPDFYQGTEFWDLSLVDPDNRRPIDFTERADVFKQMERPDWQALARDWADGHIKLAWARHLLRLRNELAEVFASGDYEPLEVSGPHRDHVIAFARRRGRHAVIVAVARCCAPLSDQGRIWPNGEVFEGELHVDGYAFEGAGDAKASRVPLASLFKHLPVAALKASYVGAAKPAAKGSRQFA
jgi:(1->4)-alpha-D-glucan 1-alpha-D-glucosylmutase